MDFVDELRRRSRYPVVRGVVRFWMGLCYLVAIGLVLMAAVSLFGGQTSGLLAAGALVVAAALVLIAGHLGRELAIMGADVADAVIDMAERQALDSHAPKTSDANLDW